MTQGLTVSFSHFPNLEEAEAENRTIESGQKAGGPDS